MVGNCETENYVDINDSQDHDLAEEHEQDLGSDESSYTPQLVTQEVRQPTSVAQK